MLLFQRAAVARWSFAIDYEQGGHPHQEQQYHHPHPQVAYLTTVLFKLCHGTKQMKTHTHTRTHK